MNNAAIFLPMLFYGRAMGVYYRRGSGFGWREL